MKTPRLWPSQHPWLALVPLLLVGCATVDAQKTSLNERPATLADVRELPRQPLAIGQPVNVRLDDASPVLSFSSGHSHAAALGLPPGNRPQTLHFKIEVQGLTSYTEATFCPLLQFLGADGATLSSVDLPTAWVAPGWVTNGYFEGFAGVPETAASVIVYTGTLGARHSADVESTDAGFAFSTGKSVIYVPGSGRQISRMPCAPTGAFAVTVLPHGAADSSADSRTETTRRKPSSGTCDKWGNPKDIHGNPCQ